MKRCWFYGDEPITIWCALVKWWDRERLWTNITNIPQMSKESIPYLHLDSSWIYIFAYIPAFVIELSLWLFEVVNEHVIVWWCGWMMNTCVIAWWLCVCDCVYVILLMLYFTPLYYLSVFSPLSICYCFCAPMGYKRLYARINALNWRMTLCLFIYL